MQCVLSRTVESMIQFDPENGAVTVRPSFRSGKTNELVLRRILEAMEVIFFFLYRLVCFFVRVFVLLLHDYGIVEYSEF